MIDKNNDIDLDKEIESLEELLNNNDEALDDSFPLDGLDEELVATPRENSAKSGSGKYIAYFAFLALLGGGGYAAYKYVPNLMENTSLSSLQNNLQNRVADFEPQSIMPTVSDLSMSASQMEEPVIEIVENIESSEVLPMASDSAVDSEQIVEDDIIILDEIDGNDFSEIAVDEVVDNSDNMAIAPVEDTVIVLQSDTNETADTIADALSIVQNVNADVIVEDIAPVVEENIAQETVVVEDVDNNGVEDTIDAVAFERIPAMPVVKNRDDILPEVVVEQELVETLVEDEISELAVIENVVESQPEIIEVKEDAVVADVPAVEEVAAEIVAEKVPSAPEIIEDIKEQVVDVVKAEPVKIVQKVAPSQPKEIVVNNKPLAKVDGRVTQARTAMENGNIQQAVDLYQAVLSDDPSSTSALTGMQLAKAKLRVMGVQTSPMVERSQAVVAAPVVTEPSVEVFPVAPVNEKVAVDSVVAMPAPTMSLLEQMNANPRDAGLAVKVAQMYQAQGNSAKAVEYYKKALQLDIVYKTGLDRMAIYDALATLQ